MDLYFCLVLRYFFIKFLGFQKIVDKFSHFLPAFLEIYKPNKMLFFENLIIIDKSFHMPFNRISTPNCISMPAAKLAHFHQNKATIEPNNDYDS